MEINHSYWEENSNIQHLKYESCNSNDGEHSRLKDEPLYRCCDSNLNFATVACSEDDSEFSQYKKNKVSRQDPMSHRIIEKRRRDRMNNCLADLSRLIPAEYLKKGRGRIEKTEIIEMAIRHIKYLQQAHRNSGRENSERTYGREQYRLGYQECMSETMRFLVEVEGYFAREALCVRLINHLQKHCENLIVRERENDDTKIHMENEYSQLQIPTIQLNNGINSTPIQQLRASPMRHNMPEAFGNVSQLRDMLSNNHVKDESRLLLNSQVIQSNSPSNVREGAATNLTRLPSPRYEKQHERQHQHQHQHQHENQQQQYQPYDQYKDVTQEHSKNRQELSNISKERERTISENDNYSNGVSLYKFKNNIKQRFSQDLNAEINQNNKFCNVNNKRRKVVDLTRRSSVTTETYSSENQSSPMDGSQCSPQSSELYRISSESENARISPTGSSVSDNRQNYRYSRIKIEDNSQKNSNERYSPNVKQSSASQSDMEKSNFSVPIFALHAKGSFYIPLTIDYQTLVPYLQHHNILDMLPNVHNIILHPVTINVNFQSNIFSNSKSTVAKSNKHKIDGQNGWH